MINFLTFSQEWKYCTSKKYVDKNFKTGVRRLLASIFCHDIVTRVTPSIIAPFFPPRRRDRISRNRYLRKLRTGRRWFNRAARSRRVRLACETETLNDSGHLSYERSRPPLLRFHRSSTGIVHPIDRVIESGYLGHFSHTWPLVRTHLFVHFSLFLAVCFSRLWNYRDRLRINLIFVRILVYRTR